MKTHLEIGDKSAGRLCIWRGWLSVHLCVRRDHWLWGYHRDWLWYDGPHSAFGLGPLLLVCWFIDLRYSLTVDPEADDAET
jgi:hypothetical protein